MSCAVRASRWRGAMLTALVLTLGTTAAAADARLVPVEPLAGLTRARHQLARPGAAAPASSHHVVGFDQRVRRLRDGRVEVTVVVDARPLPSAGAWPPPPRPSLRRWLVRELGADSASAARRAERAAALVAGAGSQLEAAGRVIAWVSHAIAADDSPGHGESAGATWRARRASCVGRSNLAIDMLRAAGVPARSVHGLVLPPEAGRGALLGSAEFELHRWIETWVDGLGWVPSDPGESVHLVDARHVALAVESEAYSPGDQRLLTVRVIEPPLLLRARRVPPGTAPLLVRAVRPVGRAPAPRSLGASRAARGIAGASP